MDFSEALKKMKSGEMVARYHWKEGVRLCLTTRDLSIRLPDTYNSVFKLITFDGEPIPWHSYQEDILADDWVVVPRNIFIDV